MDRNGYNKSLLDTEQGVCYLCQAEGQTVRHEIFQGTGERSLSKYFGLWVNLCTACHDEVHHEPQGDKAIKLDTDGKAAFISKGHTEDDFIRIFKIGNIKHWEL